MSIKLDLENSITFERPLTRVVKQNIRIENTHSKPLAYKVKTTAPSVYCVRPNYDIIPPHAAIEIEIMRKALREEPALDARCKDKFLIWSTLVEGALESMNITDLWNYVEKEAKSSISERKLLCVYGQPGQDATRPAVEATPVPAPVTKVTELEDAKAKELARKLKSMENELLKVKEENENLRNAKTQSAHIQTIQTKTNRLPVGIVILFVLLAIAVAYLTR
ncbi:PapD-like protein [Pilaira anomala]|nr:PapD-like protein [Pilaira anomala]